MKKNKKVKVGLIGSGTRLRGVVETLLNASNQIEISAVYDPNPSSVKAAVEKFNPEMIVCSTMEELLANEEIHWVMIGSWNCYHADQIIASFEAGKHVFSEKPLALTLDECLRIRTAAEKSGKIFSLGFTLRYSPHYTRIKKLIEEGRIGQLISFEFNEAVDFNHGGYIHADWRRKTKWAGTHLLEKCCHDIDVANWLVGSRVMAAASFAGCDFFTPANAYHKERLGFDSEGRPAFCTWYDNQPGNITDPFNDDKDIFDNQVAILQYANGVRATFHTNCMAGIPERRLYLCGTEGSIRADVITGVIELQRIGFNTKIERFDTGARGGHGNGDPLLGKSLADSMINGTPSRSPLNIALDATITVFGIDEAQREKRVFDLEPLWTECYPKGMVDF